MAKLNIAKPVVFRNSTVVEFLTDMESIKQNGLFRIRGNP
jgi:hypothetical protein